MKMCGLVASSSSSSFYEPVLYILFVYHLRLIRVLIYSDGIPFFWKLVKYCQSTSNEKSAKV